MENGYQKVVVIFHGNNIKQMADKTIGEIISDSNEENIELDEQTRYTNIQKEKASMEYMHPPFPMIQGTTTHASALKDAIYDEEGNKKKLGEMSGKEKLQIVGESMADTWG